MFSEEIRLCIVFVVTSGSFQDLSLPRLSGSWVDQAAGETDKLRMQNGSQKHSRESTEDHRSTSGTMPGTSLCMCQGCFFVTGKLLTLTRLDLTLRSLCHRHAPAAQTTNKTGLSCHFPGLLTALEAAAAVLRRNCWWILLAKALSRC